MDDKKVLIDVGSSTIKVYVSSDGILSLEKIESIFFNEGFSDEGISLKNEEMLIKFLQELKETYSGFSVSIYATAVFRKLSSEASKRLGKKIYEKTGLSFNVISHEMENFYLEKALLGKFDLDESVLLINVGGGSTEFVVARNGESIEKKNVDIGVGVLLKKFLGVNDEISSIDKKVIVDFVEGELPELDNKVLKAFYTGGELNYMQLANYPLVKNVFFDDVAHPSVIGFADFAMKNEEIFSKIKFQELESMMPESPKWMHGARVCSALVEAICKKYEIEYIIPSNSNLIDGVYSCENGI